jgi:hypothetical protein
MRATSGDLFSPYRSAHKKKQRIKIVRRRARVRAGITAGHARRVTPRAHRHVIEERLKKKFPAAMNERKRATSRMRRMSRLTRNSIFKTARPEIECRPRRRKLPMRLLQPQGLVQRRQNLREVFWEIYIHGRRADAASPMAMALRRRCRPERDIDHATDACAGKSQGHGAAEFLGKFAGHQTGAQALPRGLDGGRAAALAPHEA